MHIFLDARMAGELNGIGRYVRELMYALDRLDHQHHITALIRPTDAHLFAGLSKKYYMLKRDIPWYTVAEQRELPKILYFLRPDLVHFPHWNLPYFWHGT